MVFKVEGQISRAKRNEMFLYDGFYRVDNVFWSERDCL